MIDGLGRVGIWRSEAGLSGALAAQLERLGYRTVWIGASPGGDLAIVEELLDATSELKVATGIVNIWKDAAPGIAAAYHRIEARHPGRFILGVGVGHSENTAAYARPFEALVDYLDVLDAEGVPAERRLLAALGPKVLKLAAERTAGAHPYLTTPEHTRRAREIVGAGVLLAPEQKVVVDADPDRARAVGRRLLVDRYLPLANYRRMLTGLGFGEPDFAGEGSDRLVDAVIAHGDAATAVAQVTQHLDAGADHVAVQVLTDGSDPMPGFTALAEVLFG
ncbi:MAG TPA: LLM class F420-dependent oxidoreductase [Actinocrinis sp.]|jgi:probable F420-dependent oxidoreductase